MPAMLFKSQEDKNEWVSRSPKRLFGGAGQYGGMIGNNRLKS